MDKKNPMGTSVAGDVFKSGPGELDEPSRDDCRYFKTCVGNFANCHLIKVNVINVKNGGALVFVLSIDSYFITDILTIDDLRTNE